MSEYIIQEESLIALGDSIREKTGKTDSLTIDQMIEEIRNISSGGSTCTVTIQTTSQMTYYYTIHYMKVVNGTAQLVSIIPDEAVYNFNITLEDVLCNSIIAFSWGSNSPHWEVPTYDNITPLASFPQDPTGLEAQNFLAPATPNSTGSVTYYEDNIIGGDIGGGIGGGI